MTKYGGIYLHSQHLEGQDSNSEFMASLAYVTSKTFSTKKIKIWSFIEWITCVMNYLSYVEHISYSNSYRKYWVRENMFISPEGDWGAEKPNVIWL